jgi:hypothetical protein
MVMQLLKPLKIDNFINIKPKITSDTVLERSFNDPEDCSEAQSLKLEQ